MSHTVIYCSIVAATRKRLHVLPQLYKMCTDEFNGYIERLEGAGLIVRRITDNITYYDLPISSTNYSRNYILAAIEAYSKGAWQGITTALLNQQNAV